MLRFDREIDNERFSSFEQFTLEAGGINGPRLKRELSSGGVYISSRASELLNRLQKPERQEQVSVVKFSLQDVGIRDCVPLSRGWEKVVKAVLQEGLALCPQLTAPEMARLNADIIAEDEYVNILSKPIADRDRNRRVFGLRRRCDGLQLNGSWIGNRWNPDDLMIARLR